METDTSHAPKSASWRSMSVQRGPQAMPLF